MAARRKKNNEGLAFVGVVAGALVGWALWSMVDTLTHDPFGAGLLVLLGCLAGSSAFALIWLGLGIGAWLLGSADLWLVLLFVVLPGVVGFGTEVISRARVTYPDVDSPKPLSHRSWQAGCLLVGVVPIGAVLWHGGAGVSQPVLIAAAAAILVAQVLHDLAIGTLTRYVATGLRRAEAIYGGIALLLAFGPFGDWLDGLGWLHDVAWLLPVAAALALLVVARRFAGGGNRLVTAVYGGAHTLLIGKGTLVLCVAGIAHPEPRLFTGAVGVVVLQTAFTFFLAAGSRSMLWSYRRVEATIFAADSGVGAKDLLLVGWIHDAFLTRPDRPDFRLLHTMAAQATAAVMGVGQPLAALVVPGAGAPAVGESALRWIHILDLLLSTADREMRDRRPDSRYWAERDLVVAHRAISMANVIRRQGKREDAIELYQQAADLLTRHNFADAAAIPRLGIAELQAIRLGRTDEALATATAIANDDRLSKVIRQRAAILGAMALMNAGREGDAALQRDLAVALRPSRWDYLRYAAAKRPTGQTTSARLERKINRMLLGSLIIEGTTGTDSTIVLSNLAIGTQTWTSVPAKAAIFRALTLWEKKRYAEARAIVEQVAGLLVQEQHFDRAFSVRMILGTALRDVDPVGAYVNLSIAIDLKEQLRKMLVDAEARVDSSERATQVHERLVELLVRHRDLRAPGWPDNPEAEAFKVMERARSRVMLEALGSTQDLRVDPTWADLADEEHAATRELQQATDLASIRQAQRSLAEVWSSIAARGTAGAEYADLRRGEPLSLDTVRALLGGAS